MPDKTTPNSSVGVYEEITAMVRSGQYFKDAVDWYALKFIQPVTHRSFFILVTIVSVITSVASLSILTSILPVVEVLPLIRPNKAMADYRFELKKIGKEGEDPNISVIKYLSSKYIQLREDYDFAQLSVDLDYVKRLSTEEEYKRYVDLMKPDRAESLILKYRNHTRRVIEVREVVLLPRSPESRLPPNQHRIAAYFLAKEKGPVAGEDTLWKASLDVRFSDVVFYKDTEKFAPMDFIVTRYEVQQVEAKK
jgi:type IV secretory pathway component VirB8